ncbi:adenylate/guanylate cyclase domain-containing protein [Sedimentitalea todarodis]|uniref:Adenylate/guanylate cyclase domain-containing protein n=1 Tax=Sedimentitalea todarodis TaxID=1631240 RepID=A0ABU3VDG6_9RHOB|nr:adenylate/guanylate cyclase domain-containing protein [Sedimentitalea todarodis]MDU9004219.1 adenylate/guanylate cyclase domain-containing protein [Sedimentitalea todarodis]
MAGALDKRDSRDVIVAPQRRTILFADLVSYSRHVAKDEAETLRFMQRCFELFQDYSNRHDGRVVKTTGDGILALFGRAQSAVDFALEVQSQIESMTNDHVFRIGINTGLVELTNDDVFGHAVNVAARLEPLARPGGVCVSRDVVVELSEATRQNFDSLGPLRLYNLPGTYEPFQFDGGSDTPGKGGGGDVLHLSVIGGLELHTRGASRALPGTQDARLLLAYLAMAPSHSEAVGRLSALLRPDAAPNEAREATFGALKSLQETIGSSLVINDEVASLNPGLVQTDVGRIVRNAARGRLDDLLTIEGDWVPRLLSSFGEVNSAVTSWLALVRSDVREQLVFVLETEMQRIKAETDPAIRGIAQAILNIEPCHEGAARRLMSFLSGAGNVAGAIRVYDRLAQNLSVRYGLSPRPETLAASRGKPQSTPNLRNPLAPLRIQVRDFEGHSEGMHARLASFRSEIISGLSRFRSWSVVEGDQGELPDVSSDYLLKAQQSAGRSCATLTLCAAETGRIVWSEDLDIGAEQISKSRQQAVSRIAAMFEMYVPTDRAGKAGTGAHHAVVDDWLMGERLLTKWTKRAFEQGIDSFQDIIERAPEFAPAHASLASALNVLHVVRPGLRRDTAMARRALDASNIAVELDPLDARNRLALAWSAALKGNFDRAALNMDMAERLNPHSPRTLASCAMGFSFLGEHERAARVLEHCLNCAPVLLDYQWCYAASVRFMGGDDLGALQAAARSDDRIIDNPGWAAAALARLGRHAEAQTAFNKLVRDVSAVWDGETPPTPADVRDWFVNAYPIWHAAERVALAEALSAAMQGDG